MACILLVEDEPSSHRPITSFLRALGHRVVVVEEGGEAIEVGRRIAPDVLVSDWILSGERDGIDVSRALVEEMPRLPVVLMTSRTAADILGRLAAIEGLTERNVVAVLRKPLRWREIQEAVEKALAGREKPA